MSAHAQPIDAPAEDAWTVEECWRIYDRSFERLASEGDSVNERIRQAFEAGYDAARRASPSSVFSGQDFRA